MDQEKFEALVIGIIDGLKSGTINPETAHAMSAAAAMIRPEQQKKPLDAGPRS